MIRWRTGDPPKAGDYLVWCGWATRGSWVPRSRARRPQGNWFWYEEPAGINPIFHVTHWAFMSYPSHQSTEGYDMTVNRCFDCKHSTSYSEFSDYFWCHHPLVAGFDIQYLATKSLGVPAGIERKKMFFGACGRKGKLWEGK